MSELNDIGEPRSRARWLGVVLILVALAALIWQAWLGGVGDELPPELRPVAAEQKLSLAEMLARVDSVKLGMQAASAAADARLPMASDEVELCGVGRVKADEAGQPKSMEPVQLAAQGARARLLPLLLGSADEQSRAAGLLLKSMSAAGEGDEVVPSHTIARDTLASMALSTRSPQVYAWALRACQAERTDGMCQLLTSEQWVRLDPGNVIAWLQVAVDAQARNDSAAVAEALYRTSHASVADAHWGALVGLTLATLPADTPLLAKGALAEELMAIESGFVLPHLAASQYCAETHVRDANRRQTCAAVAEVFHTRGTSLSDVGMAATLGERVGWPTERVQALRDERDAVLQVYTRRTATQRERWSCAALAQTARHLVDVSQLGEIAVMRRALKDSPESTAALAKRYRDAAAKPPTNAASGAVSLARR